MILGRQGLWFDAVIFILLFTHSKIILYIFLPYPVQCSIWNFLPYEDLCLVVSEMDVKVWSAPVGGPEYSIILGMKTTDIDHYFVLGQ